MTKEELKEMKFNIKYVGVHHWWDEDLHKTAGSKFVWRITSPENPHRSELYYEIDMMTPPTTSKYAKNIVAVWMIGDGVVMSDDEEGLDWWKDILSGIGAYTTKPNQSKSERSKALDVHFPKQEPPEGASGKTETELPPIRDITVDSESAFINEFKTDGSRTVKMDRIRYIIGKSPDQIISMVDDTDLEDAYDRFKKLTTLLQKGTLDTEEPEEEEEEEPEEEEPTGPSEEELKAIEAGVEPGDYEY